MSDGEGQLSRTWRRFRRHRLALAGTLVLAALFLSAALVSLFVSEEESLRLSFGRKLQPPSPAHPDPLSLVAGAVVDRRTRRRVGAAPRSAAAGVSRHVRVGDPARCCRAGHRAAPGHRLWGSFTPRGVDV